MSAEKVTPAMIVATKKLTSAIFLITSFGSSTFSIFFFLK